jgi:cytochrome c-type biogenesis protein CcsB
MTVEYFSNLTMVTAGIVYLIAAVLHAAEWAAARKVVDRDTAWAVEHGQPEATRAAVEPSAAERSARANQQHLVGAVSGGSPSGAGVADPASGRAVSAAGDAGGRTGPVSGDKLTPRQRTETVGRMGVSLTVIALACNIAGVVTRGIAAGRVPLGNMYEFTTVAMAILVTAYLILARRGLRGLGLPVTLLAATGIGLSVTVFYVAVSPLVPALRSYWFDIHISAAVISGSAFTVGGATSILYLIKKRAVRRGGGGGYLSWLPTVQRLDVIAYRVLAFAFPLWTFTVAAGAIWAEYAWGSYWSWDPKETWALVTWVVFAGYLHARSTAGWRGTRAAWIAIVGLALFWFNFTGVNLLFHGLHSYAGI